jgi:hypothetical protein
VISIQWTYTIILYSSFIRSFIHSFLHSFIQTFNQSIVINHVFMYVSCLSCRYQHNYDVDLEDEVVPSSPAESSGYGQASYTPYTPPTAGNSIRKASMAMINNTFPEDSPSDISDVSSHKVKFGGTESESESASTTPNSKASRSPSILYSNSFSTPMSRLKESLHTTAVNNAVPQVSKQVDSPAPFVSPGERQVCVVLCYVVLCCVVLCSTVMLCCVMK